MKNIFNAESLMVLESFTFTKTLLAFDFDGTLSPIVTEPSKSAISLKTAELLKRLGKYAPIAIISGRSMADINQRINVKVKYIVGNHGLESVIAKKENLVLAKDICTQWQNKIKKQIAKSQNGISIEDKTFSLAIHFRKSRQKKEAKLSILKLIENLQPSPRVIMGKSVINILPAGAPHKGVALLEFLALSKCNRAIYVGDDETDEDVFSLPDNRILSVRIGKKRLSQAQYYINRQAEINKFLLKLIEMYEHSK